MSQYVHATVPQIGTFVIRARMTIDGVVTIGKPHYVESVIFDEPVCHCGRRLQKRAGTAFIPSDPVNVCSGCKPMVAGSGEDDGSTQPEMVP